MRSISRGITAALLFSSLAFGKIYFKETFDDDKWKDRWVSNENKKNYADFEVSNGLYGDENNKGLRTTVDNSFYAISSKMDEPFYTKDKKMVLQYSVKLEKNSSCTSNYIKLFPRNLRQKQTTLGSNNDYNILFGPNQCLSHNQTQTVISYRNKKPLLKKDVKVAPNDHLTHYYTLVINPDQTYQVLIDNQEKESGRIFDDWDILEPKMIPDPSVKKPADWVDDEYIDDPNDKRPEGLDVIPRYINDPNAEKPEDWNDEEDGVWEPTKIENPEYQEWYPRTIKNPAYIGQWIQPMMKNPDYFEDDEIYVQEHGFIGFEFYQVNAGSFIDNIIVTDDLAEAQAFAEETKPNAEVEAKQLADFITKQEELKKKREAEAAKKLEEDYDFNNFNDDDLEFLAENNDEDDSDDDSADDVDSDEEKKVEDDDSDDDESDSDDDDDDDDDEFVIYDDKKDKKKVKDEL